MIRRLTFFVVAATITLSGCSSSDTVSKEEGEADATGFITTNSGLKYRINEIGPGATIQNGNQAIMHYTGWLFDAAAMEQKGEKFDSSVDRGQTFSFTLGEKQVIGGWDEGVLGMNVGEKRTLVIPPDLGYGSRGAGGVIPPNATLLFDIELIEIGTAN
jgi:FKBP-type peptidyl-prolyl cis-trans isomerase FkpA